VTIVDVEDAGSGLESRVSVRDFGFLDLLKLKGRFISRCSRDATERKKLSIT
jgi:hypothetical protein